MSSLVSSVVPTRRIFLRIPTRRLVFPQLGYWRVVALQAIIIHEHAFVEKAHSMIYFQYPQDKESCHGPMCSGAVRLDQGLNVYSNEIQFLHH